MTVDVPVLGNRWRDQDNRLSVPLRPTPRLLWDMLRCPRWTLGIVREGVPRIQNMVDPAAPRLGIAALAELMTRNLDRSLTWSALTWIRDAWPRKLVIKGVLAPEDAELAVRHGFDAVVVSNHGGRQLDHAPSAVSTLSDVVAIVGTRAEVYLDGGELSEAYISKRRLPAA